MISSGCIFAKIEKIVTEIFAEWQILNKLYWYPIFSSREIDSRATDLFCLALKIVVPGGGVRGGKQVDSYSAPFFSSSLWQIPGERHCATLILLIFPLVFILFIDSTLAHAVQAQMSRTPWRAVVRKRTTRQMCVQWSHSGKTSERRRKGYWPGLEFTGSGGAA